MKYITKRIKTSLLLGFSAMIVFSSCNKDVEQFPDPATPAPSTDPAIADVIKNNPDDSLYYRLIVKSGLLAKLNTKTTAYTMFVPGNSAMRSFITAASGGAVPPGAPDAVFSGFITANLPAASAAGIVSYNTCPQALRSTSITSTFPNFQYPSILNPAPTVSDLLRLTTFPTTNNGAWLNNVPLMPPLDVPAANGVIHHTAVVVTPPQRFLWDRINTDAGLTYLKAAIIRADSGTVAPGTLQGALQNIGANLTVFAPTDAAFQATLTGAIYQGLVAAGYPAGATTLATATALASSPTVFSNPLLFSVLTARTVQGIVVYHILGQRAFTNNFPTTTTFVPTLLNGGVPTHPGVGLTGTFGIPFFTAATVKGAANATAANVVINASPFTPDPAGTSDQHYLNGVIHKIDQVLLPQ